MFQRVYRAVLIGVALFVSLLTLTGSASAATKPSCYGVTCHGYNPMRTSCANDAKTIGAMDIRGDGMLELRWSKKCNASWGRFSTYWRIDIANLGGTAITGVHLTAWNPGAKRSMHAAGANNSPVGATWWTYMVTGTTRSCTGVELNAMHAGGGQGWHWGPCVD